MMPCEEVIPTHACAKGDAKGKISPTLLKSDPNKKQVPFRVNPWD